MYWECSLFIWLSSTFSSSSRDLKWMACSRTSASRSVTSGTVKVFAFWRFSRSYILRPGVLRISRCEKLGVTTGIARLAIMFPYASGRAFLGFLLAFIFSRGCHLYLRFGGAYSSEKSRLCCISEMTCSTWCFLFWGLINFTFSACEYYLPSQSQVPC